MDLSDLKLSDLFVQCDACAGTGSLSRGVDEEARQTYGSQFTGGEGPCEKCGGTGGKLTVAGQVLVQFVEVLKRQHRL